MNFSAYEELGRTVEKTWLAANRDEALFPEIAHEALSAFDPDSLDLDAVGSFLLNTRIKQQPGVGFSDVPLMLYRGDGFYIELLVWIHATTAIHQHGFSGAFRVLHGSSLHSDYRFHQRRRVSSRLFFGDIEGIGMEYLGPGGTRPIRSGQEGLIHSLYHLDEPSATIVLRTNNDPEAGPQLRLLPPGFAFHARWADQDPKVAIMNRWLHALGRLGRQKSVSPLLDDLAAWDLPRIFGVVFNNPLVFADREIAGQWQPRIEGRFGAETAEALGELALAARRRDSMSVLREHVSDPDLRFFVALLMNATCRTQIYSAIEARYEKRDANSFCVEAMQRLAKSPSALTVKDSAPLLRGLALALESAGDEAEVMLQDFLNASGNAVGSNRGKGGELGLRALQSLPELAPLRTA